jgi:predicted DNA-binding ribbon-helix-helix protein
MAARVARLELEHRTYARALEIVASHPRMTKAELLARLGDRSEARAAVKALASLGWM